MPFFTPATRQFKMPIVGVSTTLGITTWGSTLLYSTVDQLAGVVTYNASGYSHSTVFMIKTRRREEKVVGRWEVEKRSRRSN